MASDPALAKSKLAKARYLEKGLLRIVLDSERERYREAIADPWKRYKYQFGWHVENTRALIQLTQSALRAAALVNAGAAVAILAFIGNTWDSDIDVSPFAKSSYWFAAGVLSATAAAGAAYFSQLLYGVQDESKQKRGRVPHAVTIALYLAAIAMFGRGCWLTYDAFIGGPQKEIVVMSDKPKVPPPPPPPRQPIPDREPFSVPPDKRTIIAPPPPAPPLPKVPPQPPPKPPK